MIRNVRLEFELSHGSNYGSSWVSIMRERQAASCISAARKRFGEIIKNGEEPTPEEENFMDSSLVGEDDSLQISQGDFSENLRRCIGHKSSQIPVHDSKFGMFFRTLEGVLGEDTSSKILVFSFFRDTVDYLYEHLTKRSVGAIRIHGGFNVRERQKIIERFRTDPQIRVLITSDVGAEGLDFQFCNTIFNYDLPWNPMKVEQRIGRIDRFGQESSRIRIYNMVIDDSIESRILLRLYNRIGLFEKAIGDIEAILGEEIRELSRKVYSSDLTPEEESRLTDQTVSSILRRQQELEEFEQKKLQFMGQEAIFSNLVNQAIDSGAYVSEAEIKSTIETFIKDAFPLSHIQSNGDGTYYVKVNDDMSQSLRGYTFNKRKMDKTAEEFLKLVTPGKEIPLTFSSALAYERKILEFISLNHTLTRAAIDYWKDKAQSAAARFLPGIHCDEFQKGEYLFFIFTLEAHGAEETRRLIPVLIDLRTEKIESGLSEQFLRLVQTSTERPHGIAPIIDSISYNKQKEAAQQHMALRRDSFEQEILKVNDAMINARLTALEQSYMAKKKRVEKALLDATNLSIRRMREGQLRNMEAKYTVKRKEIEAQRRISVSFSLDLEGRVVVNP
jgi:ATP-dependent helicase HepA